MDGYALEKLRVLCAWVACDGIFGGDGPCLSQKSSDVNNNDDDGFEEGSLRYEQTRTSCTQHISRDSRLIQIKLLRAGGLASLVLVLYRSGV